jgi:outer membrane biosynthesis protein TonB
MCVGFGMVVYWTIPAQAAPEPPLKEMITIEASLARKATKPKQPVKELKAPEPEVKPEGVSRDENKKPVEPPKKDDKKPTPPKKPDDKFDISKFNHPTDPEQPGATPTTNIGQFDGSEKGFAPLNAGDPYWGNLRADLEPSIPSISQVQGAAVACFHIEADGKIAGLKFDSSSGDQILDDAVQRSMKAVQKARNDSPQPVPLGQLGVIKKWVCFRFKPGG